jgi:hypothetical protein
MAAAFASACKTPEQSTAVTIPPTAGIRFINAVPDTSGGSGMDFRFVDRVENNAQPGLLFAGSPTTAGGWTSSFKVQYKAAVAGTRYFKIFLSDTLQSTASTVMNTPTTTIDPASTAGLIPDDTTLVLGAGKNYTVILWGNARGGAPAMRITAFEDNVGTIDETSQVALRVINATPGVISATASSPAGVVATWNNVPALSVSSYVLTPAASITYNVTGAATLAAQLAMPGVAAKVDLPAIPGTTIAGSGVSGIVWPATTAGTTARTVTGFAAPQMTFVWDRRPPRGCSVLLCG